MKRYMSKGGVIVLTQAPKGGLKGIKTKLKKKTSKEKSAQVFIPRSPFL